MQIADAIDDLERIIARGDEWYAAECANRYGMTVQEALESAWRNGFLLIEDDDGRFRWRRVRDFTEQ